MFEGQLNGLMEGCSFSHSCNKKLCVLNVAVSLVGIVYTREKVGIVYTKREKVGIVYTKRTVCLSG